MCGYEPFHGNDNQELLKANKAVDFQFYSPEWDNINSQAKDWITKALNPSAEQRFSPEEAKKHPWIRSLFHKGISNCDTFVDIESSDKKNLRRNANSCMLS